MPFGFQSGAIEGAEAGQEVEALFKKRKERSKRKSNNAFNSLTLEQSRYRYRVERKRLGDVFDISEAQEMVITAERREAVLKA